MALFASTFRSWFFMIIFTHWVIMYFWILRLKTNYCITSPDVYNAREEIFEKFYDFVCSFIYIFVYFNLKAGRTRLRYLIYYLLFYSENVLFAACYFMFSKDTNFAYKLTLLLIVVLGFWLAISFQMVYYLYCHPSQDITVCVRRKSKFHFVHNETLKPANFPQPNRTTNNVNKTEEVCDFHQQQASNLNESDTANNLTMDSDQKLLKNSTLSFEGELTDEKHDKESDVASKCSSILAGAYSASAKQSVKSLSAVSVDDNLNDRTILEKVEAPRSDSNLEEITAPDSISHFSSIRSFLTFSSVSSNLNDKSRYTSTLSLDKKSATMIRSNSGAHLSVHNEKRTKSLSNNKLS
jgi:hypothetical protein